MPDLQTIVAALSTITPHTHVENQTIHTSPSTIDELSSILRYANEQGLSVHPTGNNTKRWGRATEPAITLHTTSLNAIQEHIWQDMTASAQAGVTWTSLQQALAQHNQFVALDPLFPDTATIGGIIATNDSGALRMKYGSLRDLIIGMTIVLADGTIARSGGKVVKNVAGYDLHKLMTGAFGTLGVIAEVTFRLHALPQNVRSFTIHSPTAEPLGELLLTLSASQLSLHALQLRSTADTFALDIALATMPSVLDHQEATLQSIIDPRQPLQAPADSPRAEGPPHTSLGRRPRYAPEISPSAESATDNFDGNHGDPHALSLQPADPAVWNTRETLHSTHPTLIKATMLPTQIANISTLILALGGQSVTQSTGIMTTALPPTADLNTLRSKVESAGGHLTILRGEPIAATPPDTLPLMQSIKRSLDPNSILNPGFLPGI